MQESALITKMDKNGIGTDATIAQHIATIQDRVWTASAAAGFTCNLLHLTPHLFSALQKYAEVENGFFKPTNLGLGLVNGYTNMNLAMAKPNLRALMEV